MNNVLVTDGRQRSTLAVVRSLGRAGINVTVGEDNFPSLASSSRYCHNRFQYRSALGSPKDFITDLIGELNRKSYDMILPMTDITAYLMMEHFDKITGYTSLAMPAKDDYLAAIDKGRLIQQCQKLGIPVPETYFIDSIDEISKYKSNFSYPVVIKPRQSKYFIDNEWVETAVRYANNFSELLSIMKKWNSSLPYPMIQERILGPGAGAFLLFCHGQPRAIFFHRRIREKPPSGGVSVLRESMPDNGLMKDYSCRLLKALNWHGVAMVEFKYDNRDNLPKVMEINARLWGSLQLGIDSGVDFPSMLYRMVIDGDVLPIEQYKIGIKTRWLWGDFDSVLCRLTKSDKQQNLTANAPGRIRTTFDFLKFYQRNTKYEILKLSDIGPFLYETKEWFRNIIKKN